MAGDAAPEYVDADWFLAAQGHPRVAGFRRLAQALSSLYPPSSPEKRWVDGVLAAARQVGR